MQFTRRLHPGIVSGDITCTVRIWQRLHVRIGGQYRLGDGAVEVTSIRQIELSDVTPMLARCCGFAGVVDMLQVAKHGPGETVYLIEFEYLRADGGRSLAPDHQPE
jgi:hypothetical protein